MRETDWEYYEGPDDRPNLENELGRHSFQFRETLEDLNAPECLDFSSLDNLDDKNSETPRRISEVRERILSFRQKVSERFVDSIIESEPKEADFLSYSRVVDAVISHYFLSFSFHSGILSFEVNPLNSKSILDLIKQIDIASNTYPGNSIGVSPELMETIDDVAFNQHTKLFASVLVDLHGDLSGTRDQMQSKISALNMDFADRQSGVSILAIKLLNLLSVGSAFFEPNYSLHTGLSLRDNQGILTLFKGKLISDDSLLVDRTSYQGDSYSFPNLKALAQFV